MQMLSSTIPCPRCGAHAMITLFGPTNADVSLSEVTFSCLAGHEVPGDVSRDDALAAWTTSRVHHSRAS
jgi:hypothetical protein